MHTHETSTRKTQATIRMQTILTACDVFSFLFSPRCSALFPTAPLRALPRAPRGRRGHSLREEGKRGFRVCGTMGACCSSSDDDAGDGFGGVTDVPRGSASSHSNSSQPERGSVAAGKLGPLADGSLTHIDGNDINGVHDPHVMIGGAAAGSIPALHAPHGHGLPHAASLVGGSGIGVAHGGRRRHHYASPPPSSLPLPPQAAQPAGREEMMPLSGLSVSHSLAARSRSSRGWTNPLLLEAITEEKETGSPPVNSPRKIEWMANMKRKFSHARLILCVLSIDPRNHHATQAHEPRRA